MVNITQAEAFFLRASGRADDVHVSSRTHKSKAKRYFATESFKTMQLLNKYKNKHTVEVHEAERR